MLINGSDLNDRQKKLVLAAFIYRWTTGNAMRTVAYRCHLCDINKPYANEKSSEGHLHPTTALISDEEWLRKHAFHFVQDGSRLSLNKNFAEPI